MQSFFVKKSINVLQKQLTSQAEKKSVSSFSKKLTQSVGSKLSHQERAFLASFKSEAALFQAEKIALKAQGAKMMTSQAARSGIQNLQIEKTGVNFAQQQAKVSNQVEISTAKNIFTSAENKFVAQQQFKTAESSAYAQAEKLIDSEKLFEKTAKTTSFKLSNKVKTVIFAFLATTSVPAWAVETFDSDEQLKAVKGLLEQCFNAYSDVDNHGNNFINVNEAYEIMKEVYNEGFGFNIRRRMKKDEVIKQIKLHIKAHDGKIYLVEFKKVFKLIHDKMIDDFLQHQFKEFDKDSTGSLDENEFVQLTLSTYESLLSNNADAAFMKETITTAAKSKFHELDLDHSGTLEYDEFKQGFLDSILMTMNQTSQIRDLEKFRKFLKKQFDSHDKDSTGTIDDDEFYDMMLELHAKGFWGKQLHKEEVLKLVKEFDTNSDGSMDIFEYETLFKSLYRQQRDETIQNIEKSYQTKDDQFVTKQEVHEMMGKMSSMLFRINYKTLTDKVELLFDEYAKKGKVNKKDFKDLAIDVAEEMLFKMYHDLGNQ